MRTLKPEHLRGGLSEAPPSRQDLKIPDFAAVLMQKPMMLLTQRDKILVVGFETHAPRTRPRLHKMVSLNVARATVVFGGVAFENTRLFVYPRQVAFIGVAFGHLSHV